MRECVVDTHKKCASGAENGIPQRGEMVLVLTPSLIGLTRIRRKPDGGHRPRHTHRMRENTARPVLNASNSHGGHIPISLTLICRLPHHSTSVSGGGGDHQDTTPDDHG